MSLTNSREFYDERRQALMKQLADILGIKLWRGKFLGGQAVAFGLQISSVPAEG
jgi:hypothetical protein